MLPDHIAAMALARTGAHFAGRLALAGMPRLAEALLDSSGEVAVDLRLGTDDQRVRYLRGRIQGELTLQCQRCLEPMALVVDIDVQLGLVEGLDEAQRLPEGYEPLVVGEGQVALSEVVEDELLLALPVVPRHSDAGECRVIESEEGAVEETRDNPFTVLADLKRRS
ncbi:MAG TPA: YceD family protein [Gammaproteobacteria bacterium]|nr:YceD family protein [Gammaproteobacteria bacterium]